MSELQNLADKLVANCRAGTAMDGIREYYAEDARSVEAFPMPGFENPVTEGREGILGKQAWWNENFEVHSANVEGPYLHGDDRFSVIFEIDATHKESGERNAMKEVAVYTAANGQIVREEFFYALSGT